MSRLRISFTLVPNIDSSARRIGGDISTSLSRVGDFGVNMSRIGGMNTALMRDGGMFCQMWRVIGNIYPVPYLEIEPTIVWVLDGWTSNDVYSNTIWNVD